MNLSHIAWEASICNKRSPNPDKPVGAKRKSRFIGEPRDCRLQIDDFRFMEVARAAQALAPRVAPLF